MNNMNPMTLVKIGAAVFIGIIVLSIVWIAATTGTIVIQNSGEGAEYYLKKVGEDAEEPKTDMRSFAPSGSYTLHYKDSEIQFVKNIEVPNFFRSVTVTVEKTAPRKVERVVHNTRDMIIAGPGNQIFGANTNRDTNELLVHAENDPTGQKQNIHNLSVATVNTLVTNNLYIGFEPSIVDHDGHVDEELTPAIYDFKTGFSGVKANKTYPGHEVDLDFQGPSTVNHNVYGIEFQESEKITLDIFDREKFVRSFDISDAAETGNGVKAISISKNFLAIGYGNYFSGVHGDEPGTAEPEADYSVKVYDISNGKELMNVNLGKEITVNNLLINDNGSYLAVDTFEKMRVINTKDSSEVFTYDLSATATPQWLNNERLLFSSADHGLFELNAKTQSASTVFSAELIKISSFSVVGDKILFTAYSDRDLTRDPAPDGFIVHLDQEAKNNNALLFALPHEDEDIKITNLWDTIYASSAKSPGVMRDAQGNFLLTSWRVTDIDASTKEKINNYLKDKVPNYTDYKIVYGEGL